MTNENCSNRNNHNSRPKSRMVCHVASVLGFFTIVFSMSFVVNNEKVERAMQRIYKSVKSETSKAQATLKNPTTLAHNQNISPSQNDTPNKTLAERLGFNHLARKVNDFSKGLDIAAVEPVRSIPADYSMILPSSLSPTNDGGQVAAQILDHSVSSFFKQEAARGSFIGKAAHAVEEKMKTNVAFGGETPAGPKHNLKFQMRASQSKASMEYTGLTNAELSYQVGSRRTELEVFEPLTSNTKVVYNHSDHPDERRDVLSLRVNW